MAEQTSESASTNWKNDLEQDKLRAEIEKLRAETKGLRRGVFLNPATITSISAAFLGWYAAVHQTEKSQETQKSLISANAAAESFAQKNEILQTRNSAGLRNAETTASAEPTPARTPIVPASPTPPTRATPNISPTSSGIFHRNPRVSVCFPNAHQVGRMIQDIYSVFPNAGFDVIEAKQMPEQSRPKVTEIIYFDDGDLTMAEKLQELVRSGLNVPSSVIKRSNPRDEDKPGVEAKRGEFEIRFDRSVRSPVKSLINLFD